MNSLGQRRAVDLDLDSDVDGLGVVSSDVMWNYNDRGELIEADHEIAAHERAYKFDAIGNRKETVSGTTTLSGTDDYAANKANEYTEVEGSSAGLAYDNNGNLTGDGTLEYFWDAENRLVRVTDGTNTLAEYVYDYQGRRIGKASTASAPQGAENRIYFYHGWNLIAEYTADSSWANEDLDFNYTWGLDLSQSLQGAGGVGGLLVAEKVSTGNTGEYYPTYDGNGNVSEFINSSGAQVAHYEYDAFGNQLSLSSGSLKDLFAHRFSTKYHDDETGLYYYGFRYYDPVTGRWPSRDPIEERGGVNLYGMVGNDAVSVIDYLGLERLTLMYTILSKKEDDSVILEWLANGDSEQVRSLGELVRLAKKEVGRYCPSGVEPCNCIESLTIWSHGAGGDILFGDTDDYFDENYKEDIKRKREFYAYWMLEERKRIRNGAGKDKIKSAENQKNNAMKNWMAKEILVGRLEELGKLMCEDSKVQIRACYAGQCPVEGGLEKALGELFPNSEVGEMPWKGKIHPEDNGNSIGETPGSK